MLKWLALALVGSTLTGCAGTPTQAFAPQTRIERVAVLQLPNVPDVFLNNMSATLAGMAATKAAHQGTLRARLAEGGFDFGTELTQELEAALGEAGLQATRLAAPRKSPALLSSYEGVAAPTGVQAILDVAVGRVGYATETPRGRTDYRPTMPSVKVRLVERATGAVLYSETLKYGDKNPLLPGTQVDAPEGTYFATAEALLAGDNALRGMREAMKHLSALIAERLRQGNAQVTAGR